jgi:hypothetical protein
MPVLKIYKKDLKKALDHKEHRKPNLSWNVTHDCLIGQAAQRLFGDSFNNCAGDHITLLNANFEYIRFYNKKLYELIKLFDSHEYDTLLKKLPLKLELYDKPEPLPPVTHKY